MRRSGRRKKEEAREEKQIATSNIISPFTKHQALLEEARHLLYNSSTAFVFHRTGRSSLSIEYTETHQNPKPTKCFQSGLRGEESSPTHYQYVIIISCATMLL